MAKVLTTYLDKGNFPYKEALVLQQSIRQDIVERKMQKIDTSKSNVLILCEHDPILTFGSSAKESDLLIPRDKLSDVGLSYTNIKRGGSITFHGTGQIVGYPVLDLENFKADVRWYVQSLAEVIIRTLKEYGIDGYYDVDFPGIWINDYTTGVKKKICAFGVHLSRWVTNHGFAFNINNSLDYYQYFVPCGINEPNRTVTTL